MRAPFPYYGGKAVVARRVWDLLDDPPVYVEPFGGSAAVLLAREGHPGYEVLGDADHFVANFWRAVQADPEATAAAADHPMVEADLLARGEWLLTEGPTRLTPITTDPMFYDPLVAGWWAWCQCTAVAPGHWRRMSSGHKGVNRRSYGVDGPRVDFMALADRLRHVQVRCGDWARTLADEWREGPIGVFLDPPYRRAGRTAVYAAEATDGLHEAIELWCRARDEGKWRVVVAGYDGDFDLPGWTVIPWSARATGSGRNQDNRHREQLWCSPAIDVQGELRLVL